MPDGLLEFCIPNLRLCINIDCVTKVVPIMALHELPSAPVYLPGLMNLHGQSIPVIELASRLGQIRTERISLEASILLCESNQRRAGLIIDSIVGIRAADNFEYQNHDFFKTANFPVSGLIGTENGPAFILDVDRILDFNCDIESSIFDICTSDLKRKIS